MEDKKVEREEFAMMSIPIEMLEEIGIYQDGIYQDEIIQFYVSNGKLIIEPIDETEDYQCNGKCEGCPIGALDCNGDCASCACKEYCEVSEVE